MIWQLISSRYISRSAKMDSSSQRCAVIAIGPDCTVAPSIDKQHKKKARRFRRAPKTCTSAIKLVRILLRRSRHRRSSAASRNFLLRRLLARFLNQRLARQAHLIPFDRQHLDQHLVTELQLIANIANPMLRNLADMQQAVRAREKLDERPDPPQPHDLAEIRLADLRRRRDVAHHLQRLISARPAGREDVYG